jgi:hypothetical protein
MLRILSETAGVAAEETARINPVGCCNTPAAGDVKVLSTVVPAVTDPLVDTADENVPEVPERAPLSVVIPPTAKLLVTDAL